MNTKSKVPIAIVGLNFGRHILDQITTGKGAEWIQLAAVCDLDRDKAERMGEEYGVSWYDDLGELLKTDIPAIGLFTGPVGRANLLRQIVDAGKDCMTTKPFETDCDAALSILRHAEEKRHIIHLNSPAPCLSPDLAIVEKWKNQYDLGRPVGAMISTWAHYQEEADGSWYDDPAKCPVAPIFRLGIYLINDLVCLLGVPTEVTVMQSRIRTGRPTADNGQLSIRFRNGAIATVYSSFCIQDGDHYRNSMVLNFERGTVYRNVGSQRGPAAAELSLVMGSGSKPRQVVATETAGSMSGTYQWQEFAAAVQGEAIDAVCTPETVVAGLRVIDAMKQAAAGGGTAQAQEA